MIRNDSVAWHHQMTTDEGEVRPTETVFAEQLECESVQEVSKNASVRLR